MNDTMLTPEQELRLDKIEYDLSNIKDQELLYQTMRELLHIVPNNYALGVVVRRLFS